MEIEGYLAETAYPPHLPAPFAPAWVDHVLRHAGLRPNRGWRGPFRYLDVGCGAGLHLVAFAAAYPEGQFVGTDANGAAMARAAAIAAGVDVRNVAFRHETFAETLAHGEGGYDYMAALGVLSWVSSENRDRVMRIAGRQLAPGGAAAFGYNALPGRAPELLPQRLMLAEARRGAGAQTDAIRRVLDRLERLAAAGARGLTAPRIAAMLSARRDFDPDFLPHEYLSEHWAPLDGGAVVAAAEAEGLRLAGSLTPLEIRPDFLLRRAEREIVDMAADAAERARLTDLCIDQAFRRDLFVKADGAASGPDGDELFEERLDAWFLARAAKADVVYALETPAGRLRFDNAAARGIVAGLQAGPARLGAIDAPGTAADRLNALDALLAAGVVEPADAPAPVAARAFNAWLLQRFAAGVPSLPARVTAFGARGLDRGLMDSLAGGRASAAVLRRLGIDGV